jgi:predicted nucleotidyltransferase
MTPAQLHADPAEIAEFCRRHEIIRLELFGSVLRDDFGPESDIDVLATFRPGTNRRSLMEFITLEDELRELFGRDVDLVDRDVVIQSENYIRRNAILDSAEMVYEN